MIVLKWLVALALLGYFGALCDVVCRAGARCFFPISANCAHFTGGPLGFLKLKETHSDHGGWREGHRLARPGKTRPCGCHLFFPATQICWLDASAAFEASRLTEPASSLCHTEAMPAQAGRPSEAGLLQDAAAAYAFTAARYGPPSELSPGVFFARQRGLRCRAWAAEQPVAKLILEAPYTSTVDVAAAQFSNRAGPPG